MDYDTIGRIQDKEYIQGKRERTEVYTENDLEDDEFETPESTLVRNLQSQVKSLSSQVRMLKKMVVKDLFSSKEELKEFFKDLFET